MKVLIRLIAIAFCFVLTFSFPALASRVSEVVIHQEEYGDLWAFTVPEGILYCLDPGDGYPSVAFATDNETYAVNGTAKALGYPDIEPIWRDDPQISGLKVDISPFIKKGLELCKR
ncbi:unknown protein [Leptolyngbya sp. NIES-3755]|nr:unknown protein [Leptolyngbya sp. NIES-3755]